MQKFQINELKVQNLTFVQEEDHRCVPNHKLLSLLPLSSIVEVAEEAF